MVAIRNNGGLVFVFLHFLACCGFLTLNNHLKIALEGMGSVVGRLKRKNVAERKFEGV